MSSQSNQNTRKELRQFTLDAEEKRVKLMTEGGWYSQTGSRLAAHFYMMARADSETAISMCATQIATLDQLHAELVGQKCLTCALYFMAGKGDDYKVKMTRRQKHAHRVQEMLDRREAAKAGKIKPKSTT